MEPPSPPLLAALRDLRLASPRDLRRAGRLCRRLACDLPAFDSVWIDALVRLRRLTPFQAGELQEGRAAGLRLGDFILVDRIGRGGDSSTFLARPLAGRPACVLKEIEVPPERRPAVAERLCRLAQTSRELSDRHVVAPCEAFTIDGRIVTVSRLASGPDARARLIRQGRFSAPAVAEIARQLLTGLSAAHRLGLVHGDIRPVNVRLSPAGDATLVDLGVRPALSPVLSIHDPRPPEWYEGTAPERIGAAAPASIATDVYALGCLLWHLLAGRPPFPYGDPLAVLAAHRSRSLPDVRDFAPDAPSELAAVIAEMTRLEPAERPTDLVELSRRLRSAGPGGRSVVRRDGASSRRREGFPWPAAAAVLFALSGACLSLADREAAATFLSTRFGTMTAAPSEGVEVATPLMPLPAPDERGVLLLEQAGPYAAVDVAFRGPLVLRGRPDRPATVVITDHPLHLWADEVTLEHVNVVHRPDGGFTSGSPALLLVEAQNLTVRSCRLEAPPRPLSERRASPAGIAWRLIDRADPTAGRVTIENCVFRGVREAAFFADPPRQVTAKNLLAVGLRSVFSLRDCGRRRVDVALEGTTVRDVGAVIGIGTSGRDAAVAVRAEDCVLDVAAEGALFAAPSGPDRCRLSWTGAGTVTAGDLRAVTDGPAERVADVSSSDGTAAEVQGVTTAAIEFAGPADGSDAASVALVRGVPRRAGRAAGIDLSRLPKSDGLAGAAR